MRWFKPSRDGKPLRVVHCPVNTAGVPWQNVQAPRRRGVEAKLVVFERYRMHPEADWSLDRKGGFVRHQLAQWRAFLRRRQAIHGSDVEELDGHLRDQLAALVETGLTGDEAFLVAVKRMGRLDALSREFARAHSERLWKQLVVTADAADESGKAART